MVHIYSKESTPQNESSVVVYSRNNFFEKTQTFPEAGCRKLFEFVQCYFFFFYSVCKSCEVIVDTIHLYFIENSSILFCVQQKKKITGLMIILG